ncbi:MAG: bifunctional serine/threonine-protein kinase/formylglycine-generating enzyme family protein [Pirellulaceae bacterium]
MHCPNCNSFQYDSLRIPDGDRALCDTCSELNASTHSNVIAEIRRDGDDWCSQIFDFDGSTIIADRDFHSQRFSRRAALASGTQLSHYQIDELVGIGGFGQVYRAVDTTLDRIVAIKVPHCEKMLAEQRQRVIDEAKLAARINHNNVVSVYEAIEYEDSICLVNEFVGGKSLNTEIRNGPIAVPRAVEFAIEICKGIEAAHKAGVLHFDIKPANILISEDSVKVTDFGLAVQSPELIGINVGVFGTLPYMSPEHFDSSKKVDQRSEIYAIGIVLFQMLTGRLPFSMKSKELIHAIKESELPVPSQFVSDLPIELDCIFQQATSRHPAARFQTVSELKTALAAFADARSGAQNATAPILNNQDKSSGVSWLSMVVGTILILAIGSLSWMAFKPKTVVGDTESEVLQVVHISTNPPGARLVIMPLDDDTLAPMPELKIVLPEGDRHDLELAQGYYLVEAIIEDETGLHFQEVVRSVPDPSLGLHNSLCRSMAFSRNEDHDVIWPEINILLDNPLDDRWVFVEGGFYDSKTDDSMAYPSVRLDLDDFYVMNEEVTLGDLLVDPETNIFQIGQKCREKMINLSGLDEETVELRPVMYLSWFEALEYCEEYGYRMLTLDEYFYIATNSGTTNFPNGDELRTFDKEDQFALSPPTWDTTQTPYGIKGLGSRVDEWTSTGASFWIPLPREIYDPLNIPIGPLVQVFGGQETLSEDLAEFYPSTIRMNKCLSSFANTRSGVGFRCAYGTEPRLTWKMPPYRKFTNTEGILAAQER